MARRLTESFGNGRKDIILYAALDLFTSKGYFKTSVHDIGRHAEVSIGSIYHYFKNKEAIAKALYDHLLGEMAQQMNEIKRAHKTVQDRCRVIIATLFDLTESSPETMEFILHARHREFLPCEQPICSSKPFELMLKMVEEGIENGEICRLDPVIVATSIFGGPLRMIHLMLDGVLEGSLSERFDDVWQCAWGGVSL